MNKIRLLIQARLSDQRGYAMIIALLIFALALALVPVLLNFVTNGQKTTHQVYGKKVAEQYSADAGVSQAMWYIKYQNQNVPATFTLNLNDISTAVRITSEFKQADNITSYYITSTAGSTAVSAQVDYAAAIAAIPAQDQAYMFANALSTGLAGNIALSGSAIINSDSGQLGNIFCGQTLSLDGSSSIEGNVYAHQDVALSWSTYIYGNAAASGSITAPTNNNVKGTKTTGVALQTPPQISDSVLNTMVQGVYDTTNNLAALTPSGTTYSSGLTISGKSNFTYPAIYVVGNLVMQNVNSGIIFANQVYVTGNISFAGTQSVTFKGPVYAGGQIYTGSGSGTVVFQDNVSAASMNLANSFQFNFNRRVKVTGAFTVGSSDTTTFGSTLFIGGNFQYGGSTNLNIGSDIYIGGNLVLSNSAQIVGPQKVVVRGNLTLSGATQLTAAQIPFIILPPARITPAVSTDPATVTLANSAQASAAIYAPTAVFNATGSVHLYGSIICKSATIANSARVTYLAGITGRSDLPHSGSAGQPGREAILNLSNWGVH
jgi:hypothetical protein